MAVTQPTEDMGSARKKESSPRISQTQLPVHSLSRARTVAQALFDEFGGRSAPPHDVAIALGISPTSSTWRTLPGAAVAYGLTQGAHNSKEISLTPLGRALVSPTEEGQDLAALREAVLKPTAISEFFKKYDKAKFPGKQIGSNVLFQLGVPKERTEPTYDMILEMGREAGFIRETKTGLFVSIDVAVKSSESTPKMPDSESKPVMLEGDDSGDLEDFARKVAGSPAPQPTPIQPVAQTPVRNNRVYISHGKHREIVKQLKEIITYGKYEPVISVENETPSIPVPDKVLVDMRSCAAGIINVHGEGEWTDAAGNKYSKINDNVLIEIGAAMALYGRKYILLVQRGVTLPSNLQGLYRCEYDGEKLDFDTTMKLLKIFNEFDKM